ncbi:MAG: hypothetical protein HKN79_11045 [Flavobacteriales bacterium]|nr:hypothetical protein [Flavobacteriales bacterium]
MSGNPFKIIEPTEQAPESVRGELMGSIDNVVLMLRFVQLFVADTTAVALNKMKIDLDTKKDNPNNEDR